MTERLHEVEFETRTIGPLVLTAPSVIFSVVMLSSCTVLAIMSI